VSTKKRGRPKPGSRRNPLPARELALQILVATESRSAYSDRLLESRLKEADLKPEDAHLVTAIEGYLNTSSVVEAGSQLHVLGTFGSNQRI